MSTVEKWASVVPVKGQKEVPCRSRSPFETKGAPIALALAATTPTAATAAIVMGGFVAPMLAQA